MNNNLCLAVVADSHFEKYIPYYIYFALSSYPDYFVKIFFIGNISSDVVQIIKKIDGSNHVTIENKFHETLPYIFNIQRLVNPQQVKLVRWLIPESFFEGFDYVYVGDIDILICKEPVSILDLHKEHCFKNNIPYSNCIRPGTKRLTGLHFFYKKNYFESMNRIITRYRNLVSKGKIIISRPNNRDEHVLFKMVLESGIGWPREENRIDVMGSGPHHGLHIGIWKKQIKIANKQQELSILNDSYIHHYLYFCYMRETKLFKILNEKWPLKEIDNMERYFQLFHNM